MSFSLRALVRDAAAPSARLALVEGLAGIGKRNAYRKLGSSSRRELGQALAA